MESAVELLTGGAARADARRNAVRLVEAARSAVDEVGVTVSAHEIARRAEVGIGTFYRRVGSREALLSAVLAELIDEMTALARNARDRPDPWPAFEEFATTYVRLRTTSCGLNEALGGQGGLELADKIVALRNEFQRLIRRVAAAGELRTGVTTRDVAFALATVVPAGHTLGLTPGSGQWRRNLRIVLNGLRAIQADVVD